MGLRMYWQIGILAGLLLPLGVGARADGEKALLKAGEEMLVVPRSPHSLAHSAQAQRSIEAVSGLSMRRQNPLGMQVYGRANAGREGGQIGLQEVSSIKTACALIMQRDASVLCEPNYIYRISQVPNDTLYSSTWGMAKIDAPSAWDISTGSAQVLVAVVDTGVDYSHPDLASNVAVNLAEVPGNFVDDDGNGYTDDYYGYDFSDFDGNPMDENEHGTHVAGTIGAVGNNARGVAGVNWTVSLLAVRVLDASGSGTLEGVAAGIDYAAARGADVINLSLGGPSNSYILEASLQRAGAGGAVIAVAAGNESSNNDYYPAYPANCNVPEIISVAATDSGDNLAWFSNYGAAQVDLAAPGQAIYSTIPGNSYASFSGTSMAAPHVAGVAALVKSVYPSISPQEIKSRILSGAQPVAGLQGLVATAGRLSASGALAGGTPLPTPVPTSAPTPDPDEPDGPDNGSPYDPPDYSDPGFDPIAPIASLAIYQRLSKAIKFYGYLYDSATNESIVDEPVYLICNDRITRSTYTDESGLMYFGSVKKASKAKTCYVEAADLGITSNALKVPKMKRR